MDILEQLRKEQERREGASADRAAVEGSEILERALERLYAGLERLADGLRELQPDVRVEYELEGIGKLSQLQQQGYAVQTEDPKLPRFAFSFKCVGERPLTHVLGTAGQKNVVRKYLEEHNLKVHIDDLSTWRYVVSVLPVVPVRLVFEPAPDGATIRVTARNLDGLGDTRYSLRPDVVYDDLFNEIGKWVLRRENRFAEFSGNAVPDDVRQGLQDRVRRRQRSREKESRAIEAEEETKSGLLKSRKPRRGQAKQPPATRPAASAPDLGADDGADPGVIDWEGSEPSVTPPRKRPQPDPAPGTAPAPPRRPEAEDVPAYAWLITANTKAEDTAASTGRHGPPGSKRRIPTSQVLNEGEHFRLMTREGEVRFTGMIAGVYQGVEPLNDFGLERDCYVIQYLRGDRWVRVRPTD